MFDEDRVLVWEDEKVLEMEEVMAVRQMNELIAVGLCT